MTRALMSRKRRKIWRAWARSYVERKRSSGFIYIESAKLLWRFARFGGKVHISQITEQHVNAFLTRSAISNNTWRRYSFHVHMFFVYWFARRQLRHIPKPKQKPAVASTFFPYVYTRVEIRKLLEATVACQRFPRCLVDAIRLKTILLLIYGTGLRIGDVLKLLDSDVDLRRRTIHIRGASALLTRKIPIGADVTHLLRRYLKSTHRKQFETGKALFLTSKGNPNRYAVIGHAFQQLRKTAGIKRPSSSYQPRIHDLRHTFAVHSIVRWTREGLSTDKLIPILAAFMGNLGIERFEWYLELSPSSFRAQLNRLRVTTRPRKKRPSRFEKASISYARWRSCSRGRCVPLNYRGLRRAFVYEPTSLNADG